MAVLLILIADDDMASSLIMRKMLTLLGHKCDVVSNGVEAVQAACVKEYDMVFLDLYMPELSGIHAALAIRSLRTTSPVLVGIASSVDFKEIALCKEVGMAGVVLKPFDRESIARLIQSLRPQPALAVHEARIQEEAPRSTNSTVDEHVDAGRSPSHQAPSCRAAIERATNVREPIRNLRSRSYTIQPSCGRNPTRASPIARPETRSSAPSTTRPAARRAAQRRSPAAAPARAPARRAFRDSNKLIPA